LFVPLQTRSCHGKYPKQTQKTGEKKLKSRKKRKLNLKNSELKNAPSSDKKARSTVLMSGSTKV